MNKTKIKIHFAGGAMSPTGSNFILSIGDKNIMIDCGLYQGSRVANENNFESFDYNPSKIDVLFVTHAHLDHVGRIPKLVKEGFSGVIMSTAPTRDMGELIMLDSMNLIQKEKGFYENDLNKSNYKNCFDKNDNQICDSIEHFYEEKDVMKAIQLWHVIDYHKPIIIETSVGNVEVTFLDSGHILGSAMIKFVINNKSIMFTGDLGNSPSPLLLDTEKIEDINYLIMESVYGDRNHDDRAYRVKKFKKIIKDAVKKKSVVMIPAFSIERTQEMLYYINELVENKQVEDVSVYLDSPLAIHITEIYKKYKNMLKPEIVNQFERGDDIFKFPKFVQTLNKEDSIAIKNSPNPKIIIAGSGMSVGGRIVHHEYNYLGEENATLLLVGYQAPGSLGRILQDGEKNIRIYNKDIKVKCKVEMIGGFSAHKDSDNLLKFVGDSAMTLEKVFVVLGEQGSSLHLAQRIHESYFLNVEVPEHGDVVEIAI